MPVEVSVTSIEYGGKQYNFVAARDVAERKLMQDAMQEEATRRKILIDESSDGIVVMDTGGGVCEANQAYADMLGYTLEEVLQLHIWDWNTDFSKEELLAMVGADETPTTRMETRHLRRDGTYCDVDISTSTAVLGDKKYIFCACRDITDRKRLEESLKLTQFSVDQAGDLVFWLGENGEVLFTNQTTCRELGYSREELLAKTIYDVDPNAPRPWSEHWREVKEKGKLTFETIHVRSNGKRFPVEVTASCVEYGDKGYIMSFSRDITERKRMEKKFRLTQYSVDHSGAQIFWVGPDGILTYANDTTCQALGYTREEMLCMSIRDIDPKAGDNWERNWQALKEKGNVSFETVHYTKDGVAIPVEVTSAFVKYEGHEYSFQSARDISGRKKLEESLKLTQFSVDNAGDLVFWLDEDAKVVFANDTTCRQLGYSREELAGMSIYDFDPTAPRPWAEHWQELKTKGSITFETTHQRKSGKKFPAEVTASYVEYGGKAYDMAFSRDTTERKRMEKKFRLTQYSVDHSEGQIFWVGPDGILTYASEGTCKALGYTREEMLCMNIVDIDPSAKGKWDEQWTAREGEGQPVHRDRALHERR